MATEKLTAKQEKALAALLTEPTIQAAATKTGIGERTLHTWLSVPSFADAYRAARRNAVTQAVARLQNVSSAAVSVLLQIAGDKSANASTRLRAAIAIIELGYRGMEIDDISARLEALEAAAGSKA